MPTEMDNFDDTLVHHEQPPLNINDDGDEEVNQSVEATHEDYDMMRDATTGDHIDNGPADFGGSSTIIPSHEPFNVRQESLNDDLDTPEKPEPEASPEPEPQHEPEPELQHEPEPESELKHRDPEPEPTLETEKVPSASPVHAPGQSRSSCAVLAFLSKVYLHENVQHVLLWRNIGLTVGVLVLFLYTAFSIALLSFLSVVGYFGLAIIVCTFAIRLYRDILAAIGKQQGAHFFILDLVDRAGDADWSLPKDCVQAAAGKACEAFNAVASDLRDVIVVRSYARTIKAVVGLYFLTWIGSIFNLLTIIILVVLNLFYIPLLLVKFDLLNNKEINSFVLRIHGHIQHGIDVVREKAPFLVNFFESKVKTS